MHWETLEDSNVTRAAWDPETHELHVEFASGNTYLFEGVPRRFFTELKAAANKSRYVRSHLLIRYEYRRVQNAESDLAPR